MICLICELVVCGTIDSTDEACNIDIEVQMLVEDLPEYDIPLDVLLQEHIYLKCLWYDIPYELVLAVIKTESDFDADAFNKRSHDYGIMQINKIHKEAFAEAGYTDIFDPYQNTSYGIGYLAGFYHAYDQDEHKALMCYNMGEKKFRELSRKGITSSVYSREVVKYKEFLLGK